MISHCTCYCWKAPGHLRDSAGVSAILFVCSFADPTLFPPFLQVLSIQFLSYVLHAFKQTCWCTIRYLCLIFTWLVYFRSFIFSFVGSDPDPSLFWCNNETAVSGVSLESCKNKQAHSHTHPPRQIWSENLFPPPSGAYIYFWHTFFWHTFFS